MSASPKPPSLIQVATLCFGMALGGVLDEMRRADPLTEWKVRYFKDAHARLPEIQAWRPDVAIFDRRPPGPCAACPHNCALALATLCPNLPLLLIGVDPKSTDLPPQVASGIARCVPSPCPAAELSVALLDMANRIRGTLPSDGGMPQSPPRAEVQTPASARLWESAAVQRKLRAIVAHLEDNPSDREDLFQEALFHLWRRQQERLGQTLSWYVQSCEFHVKDTLEAGRSIDSAKRQGNRVEPPPGPEDEDGEDGIEALAPPAPDDVVSQVCLREEIPRLMSALEPRERTILTLHLDEYTTREIAERIGIDHMIVLRALHRIAAVAVRLRLGS